MASPGYAADLDAIRAAARRLEGALEEIERVGVMLRGGNVDLDNLPW